MAKRNTSIHINGKRYDAITGSLLGVADQTVARPAAKSIDGVVGGSRPAHLRATKVAAARASAPHAKTHHTAPSATLMRHAVSKPTVSTKRRVKVQTAAVHVSSIQLPAHLEVSVKHSVHRVNQTRLARASATQLSPRVARFAHEVSSLSHSVDQAVQLPQTFQPSIVYRADITPPKQQSSDIFEQALRRATTHEVIVPIAPRRGKRLSLRLRRRMVSYAAGAMAVLALAGFVGAPAATSVKYHVAATRTGFSASMPAYQPEGFRVENVQSSTGFFGVRYSAAAMTTGTNRSFALTEKPSSWNSDTLLAHIIDNNQTQVYNAVQAHGRTIYIYGRNQAAWVHHGVLYQLLGNGMLSTDDFTKIAASL